MASAGTARDAVPSDPHPFLDGGGDAGSRLRAIDWSRNPLGDPGAWPQSLRTLVGVMLGSLQPMLIVWGPTLVTLYNDGYAEMCGARHPAALGGSFDDLWADIWDQVDPIIRRTYAGESTHMSDIAFTMHRHGYPEETHFAFGYSPVRGDDGAVAGMFCACVETTRQVMAERQLRESEERFRNMADHAPVMTWVTDPGGSCTYVNRLWYEFTGQADTDAVGLGWLDAVHPDDRAGAGEDFVAANSDRRPFRHEYRLRRADGAYRWAIDAASPRFGPDGTYLGYVGSVIDIDERREIEDALRASERELRLVADAMPLLVGFVDRDLVYRFANEAYRDWFGLAPEQVVGSPVREILGDAGFEARRVGFETALSGGEVRFDLDWPRRDGSERIADIRYIPRKALDGSVDGFHVVVADVTDNRRSQRSLAEQNAHLEREVERRTRERDRIWKASNDLLSVATLDGFLVSVNPAWTATLGFTEQELAATPYLDLVHPDDRAATETAMAALGEGRPVLGFENRYRHKDGTYRWLSWNGVPHDGHVYSTVRDVTPIREQAEENARLEDQLRQAQKMEAVGQLTGGVAHDFNNLLTGISGSLELLQSRMSQGRMQDVDRYITAAQGASKRAAALTHRLLAFSRRQTLAPQPTDVNRLIDGMEELVRRTVGPSIAVEVVGAGGLWTALVDPNQLENALLNLCINARDAMPDGGRITIETANRWLDDRTARQRDLEPGQYLSLCVTDTGTGMTPDVVEKAFDPFFTTKPIGEGTGLGLSMIYGFARQSGGQARIYSEVGQGTTVCLYVPRHHGSVAEDDDSAPAKAARAEEGETVLVVDDEPTVRMLVTEVLEDLGYTAIEAADGAAGLRVLESNARIDLLVTDVGLPGGLNGRQVADAARVFRPGLKVLFITGYAENAVIGNGVLEPGMQVLTKPFVMDVLANRIRGMIEER